VEEDASSEYRRLVDEILSCTKCPLHLSRRNPVPGEGRIDAEVMFVGEAPGRREDELGRPFVGMAGKLLDKLLSLAGLSRGDVYITNVVKCRPPGNRDPRPEEIAACLPYLRRQILIVRPKLIVALGRIAGKTLFEEAGLKWTSMARERGRARRATLYGHSVILYATYHPAAALYNPQLRSILEEDFRRIPEILGGERGRGRRTLEDFF